MLSPVLNSSYIPQNKSKNFCILKRRSFLVSQKGKCSILDLISSFKSIVFIGFPFGVYVLYRFSCGN